MDQREQSGDHTEALQAMLDGRQARLWTAMPGIIQSFNAAKMTCEVQISIMGLQTKPDGSQQAVKIALCVDCPVVFPSGGGFMLTFYPEQGDECLLVFASRCIDAWWQSGGIQKQQELRMHDLSDGFAIPGPRSVPNALTNIKEHAVQLRSNDGNTYMEINSDQKFKVVAPGGITLNGVTIDSNGNVAAVKDFTSTGNASLGGGGKKVVLDGDPVVAGVVVASSTKTKAT